MFVVIFQSSLHVIVIFLKIQDWGRGAGWRMEWGLTSYIHNESGFFGGRGDLGGSV